MTGTIFIGLFSAKLIVSWQRGEKVKQLRMRSLDDNWYFSKDNGGFPVWYLSDIGVIRKDHTTLADTMIEIVEGDTVLMDVDMDMKELQFFVNQKKVGPKIEVEGEFYPAVFIQGDEGDCVCFTEAEVVKWQRGHKLCKIPSLKCLVSNISSVKGIAKTSSAGSNI